MISMEKASLALNLTIEIRNKLVEAYQEIMDASINILRWNEWDFYSNCKNK